MSVGLATRGLYGPAGPSPVGLATGGHFPVWAVLVPVDNGPRVVISALLGGALTVSSAYGPGVLVAGAALGAIVAPSGLDASSPASEGGALTVEAPS